MGSSDESLELSLPQLDQVHGRQRLMNLRALLRLRRVTLSVVKIEDASANCSTFCLNDMKNGHQVRFSELSLSFTSPPTVTANTIPSPRKLPFVHGGESGTTDPEKAQSVLILSVGTRIMPIIAVGVLILVLVVPLSTSALPLLLSASLPFTQSSYYYNNIVGNCYRNHLCYYYHNRLSEITLSLSVLLLSCIYCTVVSFLVITIVNRFLMGYRVTCQFKSNITSSFSGKVLPSLLH